VVYHERISNFIKDESSGDGENPCLPAGRELTGSSVEMMGIEPMSKIIYLKQSTSLVCLVASIEK